MSLLDLAKEIKNNFDPATDKVNSGGDKIPAGVYDAVIANVEFQNYDSGWENIVVTTEITTGELSGRKELVSFSFIEEWKGKEIPRFVQERNMKLAQKLAFIGEYAFKETDFQDTYSVALALKNIIGTQLLLTIKERKNKKDPENPFREYEVDAYPKAPNFAPEEKRNDFPSDEDMPF
ncbi:hypothetical protein [Enterococcus ratti]|uniref:DUF669 domain-containing protein n=1 Tax=Enterococcus ratti TaxID=150033 RepID=A0A1L8WBA1_9ENTE|nr:hypothetical protein [Enterococcus ratti]OJG77962.1 hypothetical protein RV14_GL001294 [Enterococcus ratti]